MNNVNMTGRLVKDPELKSTSGGNNVVSFALAVDRKDKNKTTDFFPCIAWNKTAEVIAEYLGKGSLIGISGVLTSRTYEDNTVTTHKIIEILVNSIDFLDSKKKEDRKTEYEAPKPPEPPKIEYEQATIGDFTEEESLPFSLE